MFSAKSCNTAARETLYDKIPQQDIFESFMVSKVEFGRHYVSPFRADQNPGCAFYINDQGILLFHDFAKREKYDALKAVQKLYGLSRSQAIDKIYRETNVRSDVKCIRPNKSVISKVDKPLENLQYWSEFFITKPTLELFNVTEVRSVYYDGKLKYRGTPTNPIYAYNFPSGRFKLYRPLTRIPSKK
jgi:hypothetical protein